ncbi:MAG: PASTA domain-containing protein, partial [Pseudonocardiaceae bacterium]
ATPQYSGAVLVWPDGSRPAPICDTDPPRLCGNGNIFGGKVPARTWYNAMVPLHEGLPVMPMPPTEPRYVTGGGTPVPDVVGQGENSAQLTLERAGFRVKRETAESDQPTGTVASQSTRSAMPGDTVTIVISSGKPRPRATPVYPSPPPPEPERSQRQRQSTADESPPEAAPDEDESGNEPE